MILRDINVDGVVAVGATNAVNEREVHNLRVLTQPPDVGLVASQACAVDTALLSCADADSLSVFDIAHRVRLSVLQRNERDDKVALCLVCEHLVLCGNVLKQSWVVELHLVASLLEGHAKHLLVLNGVRTIRGIDLYNVVCALALVFKNLKRLRSKVGGNHAVAHLTFDQRSSSDIAGVAQSHEVAVRAHAVSAACAGIGTSEG